VAGEDRPGIQEGDGVIVLPNDARLGPSRGNLAERAGLDLVLACDLDFL
jgi:hypothetical protein